MLFTGALEETQNKKEGDGYGPQMRDLCEVGGSLCEHGHHSTLVMAVRDLAERFPGL